MSHVANGDERILLDQRDQVATLTVNRPEKLNALDPAMLRRLEALLRQIEADESVRVVLLTGAGDRALRRGGHRRLVASGAARDVALVGP